jgi:Ser/Thr protein kinase RdoA (MazF antagonist)
VLRVHRLGYHSHEAVMSELRWMTSLREAGAINAPAVIPTADGRWIVGTEEPGRDEPRMSVLFEFVPGAQPSEDDLVESFEPLGEMTARADARPAAIGASVRRPRSLATSTHEREHHDDEEDHHDPERKR